MDKMKKKFMPDGQNEQKKISCQINKIKNKKLMPDGQNEKKLMPNGRN